MYVQHHTQFTMFAPENNFQSSPSLTQALLLVILMTVHLVVVLLWHFVLVDPISTTKLADVGSPLFATVCLTTRQNEAFVLLSTPVVYQLLTVCGYNTRDFLHFFIFLQKSANVIFLLCERHKLLQYIGSQLYPIYYNLIR